MPIISTYNKEEKILFAKVINPISYDDFILGIKETSSSEEYPANIRTIWDIRDLDFSQIDTMFLKSIIQLRLKYPERTKANLAYVVKETFQFGMARMYGTLSQISIPEQNHEIFTDMPSAIKWIKNQS